MSTALAPLVVSGGLLIVVGGLAATGPHIDAMDDLRASLDTLMTNTVRDLSVGWLRPLDAYGTVSGGAMHEVELLARADGAASAIDLARIVAFSADGANVTLTGMSAVRDEDGSLDGRALNEDDMVRLVLAVSTPGRSGDTIDVTLHPSEAAPLRLTFEVPWVLRQDRVALDITSMW